MQENTNTDFFPAGATAARDTIPPDSYTPKTIINSTPIVVGKFGNYQGTAIRPYPQIFVPRGGVNGGIYCLSDQAGSGPRMDNDVLNLCPHGWGGIVKYNRHDDAAFVLTTGSKTTLSTVGLYFAFGQDAAHTGSTNLGNLWTYTRTCNRIGLCMNNFTNGGNMLLAIDGSTTAANGFGVLTVTQAQETSGEFGTAKISSLPSPWSGLSTLVGCKYVTSYNTVVVPDIYQEVWNGSEGSHTLKIAPTSSSSVSNTVGREYLSGGWYQSATQTALTSGFNPPSAGVNTNGDTLAMWCPGMQILSMNEFVQQYQPIGTTADFVGGNHTDPGTLSQESCASGHYSVYGITTSGSANVTGCSNTDDIQDGDNLVIWSNPYKLVTVLTPSGKTSTQFTLTGNATLTTTNAVRITRADWTVNGAATSATQTLNSVTGIKEGDVLIFLSATAKVMGTVNTISGSTVILDTSITTTNGMYVIKISDYQAPCCLFDDTPVWVRPYEIYVCATNNLTSVMHHTRAHPELGSTLSLAAAKGATTVTVTSATGFAIGQTLSIFGATTVNQSRHVCKITGIAATVLTIDRALPFGFASGARCTYGYTLQTTRQMRTGDTYSYYYQSTIRGYNVSDAVTAEYWRMMTLQGPGWLTGATWQLNGTKTSYTWVNSSTDSANVTSVAAYAMYNSISGVTAITRMLTNNVSAKYQTRADTYSFSKFYSNSDVINATSQRNPGTVLQVNWAFDYRNNFPL